MTTTPKSKTMVLRSDTRILDDAAQITQKEGSRDGSPSNKPKMAHYRRMGGKKSRVREYSSVKKEQTGYFQLDMDIIWEILLRVSIEALMACRCVCKTWYSMTKNPTFMNLQMHISSKRPPRFICRTIFALTPFAELDRLILCDIEEGKTRNFPLDKDMFQNSELVFSHNGLICLAPNTWRTRMPLVICNPIINECIGLPRMDSVIFDTFPLVGFCFVPVRQRHIVVRISTTLDADGRDTRFYILTSGQSSWQWLTHCPCLNNYSSIGIPVYWNNTFHWKLGTARGANELILSFDTICETFQIILFPDHIDKQDFSLLVLNHRLTLIECHREKMKLWEVMGDRVGEFSLVFRETYDIDARQFSLVSRLNDNESLLISFHCSHKSVRRGFHVASNDMRQLRTLKIDGLPAMFNPFSYNPTLVSPYSMGFPAYHLRS